MSDPTPPIVTIVYRDGTRIPSPVKYLGWKQTTKNDDCWEDGCRYVPSQQTTT